MSPSCVGVMFEGDNGGATARGVTATEIRIAVGDRDYGVVAPLFEYFNRHYEFYGRRLKPVIVPIRGSLSSPADARAYAAEIAAQNVFAVAPAMRENGGNFLRSSFYQEMARSGVIAVANGAGNLMSDRTVFDALHPYVWSVYPSAEDTFRNMASFVCTSLVGRPASHADSETLRSTTRRFGVVAQGQTQPPSVRGLEDALQDCGADPVVVGVAAANDSSGTELKTALGRLEAAGVTTVMCACEGGYYFTRTYQAAADNGFRPEWIFTTTDWGTAEETLIFQSIAFGLQMPVYALLSAPKLLPVQARPWYRALQEAGPEALQATGDTLRVVGMFGQILYESLMVLAAGVQGAGPNLTSDAFAAALLSSDFPNPGAGQAPYWQPSAGFGPGDHSFYDDYTLAWWSAAAEPLEIGSTAGRGSWCYVNQGARYSAGGFPAEADNLFFDTSKPCR